MFSAIILAAGQGKRMGRLKQLLPWDGHTLIEQVVGTVISNQAIDDQIIVVLGAGATLIRPVLAKYKDPRLCLVDNPDYKQGMLSSIKVGLRALSASSKAFLVVLGDQPLVTERSISAVIEGYRATNQQIIIPQFNKRRGHPVLVETSLVPEIMGFHGEGGLRNILKQYPNRTHHLPLDDQGILIDLDYPEDYQLYQGVSS